ncbi:MAG: tryptophan--tRNA ligase [Bacteriovoracaceae bacterium]|jgi:tryptophanyl-tRNA synthetase|nr:tryptophan--tRNA ligase [Bacteriovoracaceae bacterium]
MSDLVVSGMRPTGSLHMGHYVGVIENWLDLQKKYPCYFFLADWHALTSNYQKVEVIKQSRYEYVKGWIASGIDAEKCVVYNQSAISEVLNLSQLFLCLTPPGWAERSPSWKDLKTNPDKVHDNLGFFTYPVLQSADISIMNGKFVPVGEDQVAHVELSRDIVKKFNRLYRGKLKEPEAILTKVSRLVGTDGDSKMSSSKKNAITLRETEKSLQKKVNKMVTDMKRMGINDAGNPDNCSVFSYHKIFSPNETVVEVDSGCRKAQLGCGECKAKLGGFLKEKFIPIAEKMNAISDADVDDILSSGNKRAKELAGRTWDEVQTSIKFL